MTDRFNTLTVVLENDISDYDAETLMIAIRQMRGVFDVEGNVSDITARMAEARAKRELGQKLWEVLYPKV